MLCCFNSHLRRILAKQFYLGPINNCNKVHEKYFSGKVPVEVFAKIPGEQPPKKTKKPAVPKITLLSSSDGSVTVTTLEEAQHLSKRRDLKLIKVKDLDTKSQRAVYQLMTGAEYHAEELKQREERKKQKEGQTLKGEKILLINAGIAQHDLEVHIKKIVNWLSKKFEVRVTISGNEANMEQSENVYRSMESALKDQSRFLQKRSKGSDLKFQLIPPKDDNKETKNTDTGTL